MSKNRDRIIIFDLDCTLFMGNASVAFGAYLYRHKQFSLFKMLKLCSLYGLHKCKLLTLNDLHKTIFYSLFWKQSAGCFFERAKNFLDKEMETLLDPVIVEKLKEAKSKNFRVALFSSSPDFLVERIAKRLQISLWMGSEYRVDERGQFSMISYVVDGEMKAERVKKLLQEFHLNQEETVAYSDSFLDIALLKSVGEAIAVNPDKKLLKICKLLNWRILNTKDRS